MTYHHHDGMIYDPDDGQTIATMHTSATPEQAALLAAAPDLLLMLEYAVARIEIAHHDGDRILSAWLQDAKQVIEQAKTP